MTFVLEPRRLDDPDVLALVEQVQAEYVVRYGGPDTAPIDPAEFLPPAGTFLLGRFVGAGAAVAMGGWRLLAPGRAEVRRMFVVSSARERGLATALLRGLEASAVAAGVTELVLMTGRAQPEAVAFYRKYGYVDVEPFGHYAGVPGAIHLGKTLNAPGL